VSTPKVRLGSADLWTAALNFSAANLILPMTVNCGRRGVEISRENILLCTVQTPIGVRFMGYTRPGRARRTAAARIVFRPLM
jgi:hypothetical protein